MPSSSNASGDKTQEQKFREWDEAGSDVLEPLDPAYVPTKTPEQLMAEHPEWRGYRQAMSAIKAQGLD